MKCQEAAEFVSALCDGERIPRAAAEHVGMCEACRARLNEYTEMGAELRRIASLESPEEARALVWKKKQRTASSWWGKGWETMRIPRFAFALLLVAVVVLGSSLAIVKARAHGHGSVLMLTVKQANGQSMRCPLLLDDGDAAGCSSVLGVKSGLLANAFRVIANDGNRFELGVRAKFTALAAGKSHTVSIEDVRNLPERDYWFEPGEKLEIGVTGSGTIVVTGELMDHLPSIVTNDELDPKQGELRVISPILLRGKEVVFDFEGFETTAIEKRQGVVFYTPREGRYVLSLLPFEGAVQGRIKQSRVSFEMNGQSYAFLMAEPIASAEQMWILHEPNYKPSREEPGRRDDQAFAGTSDLTHLLAKAPAKN